MEQSARAGARRLGTGERYAVALLVSGLALALQKLLPHVGAGYFYPVFLAAVAFSAWYGGFGPGLLTAAATAGSAWLAFEAPPSLDVSPPADWGDLAGYFASGVLITGLITFQLAARRRAERAAARTARVHALNLSLGPVLSPSEVADHILRHASEAVNAQGGAIALLGPDGVSLEVLRADVGADLALASAERGPLGHAAREGTAVYLESGAERRTRYPDVAGLEAKVGSLVALPFMPGGSSIGALELRFEHDRKFPEDDRSFLSTLVGQGALALERARLYAAEREAHDRSVFLAEASAMLASSLDYRATLAAVARLSVPRLADWCGVDVVDEDGRLRRVAVAHVDPARVEDVWEMSRRYVERADDPMPSVVRSGTPLLLPKIPEAVLQAFARDEEHLSRLRAMGLRSLLVVPMQARDRILGAIVFVTAESGRDYGRSDLLLSEDLARRAAVAIDNARLFEESRAALRARSESLALLDTVFIGAPVGLAFVDEALRFVRINDALAGLNGQPPEAHLGRTIDEVPGTEGILAGECFRQVLESGEPVLDREIRGERYDGSGRFIALASYYPVRGTDGGVHYVGVIVIDVTERRRADELQVQSQRMEAIAKVAGGVAHEVNNMMTVITGFSGFLEEATSAGDPRLADIAEIRKAADRAAGITRQLLAYSRQQVLRPRVLDLNDLLRGMTTVLQRLLGPDIALRFDLVDGVATVQADRTQLEQCMLNLAINARDAMDGAGELSIATTRVSLDEGYAQRYPNVHVPPGRYVRVTFSDTGQGMDAGTRARVFEPFFTTKPVGQGTGLGLATVYGIVKQSDGFIWAYGEPGQGAVFKIYLPEQSAIPATTGEHAIPRDAPAGAERILLVEDEEAVRRMAARALASRGYTILEAANGAEALDLVSYGAGQIDLVVTDVIMPDVGGGELGERLAELRPGLPVLFISGYTDDDVVRRGLLSPGSPFLQKPFEPDALARKVREVIERVRR
jgi:two-component system cell cycle sensor histidine kinase/response regulator CckA